MGLRRRNKVGQGLKCHGPRTAEKAPRLVVLARLYGTQPAPPSSSTSLPHISVGWGPPPPRKVTQVQSASLLKETRLAWVSVPWKTPSIMRKRGRPLFGASHVSLSVRVSPLGS